MLRDMKCRCNNRGAHLPAGERVARIVARSSREAAKGATAKKAATAKKTAPAAVPRRVITTRSGRVVKPSKRSLS